MKKYGFASLCIFEDAGKISITGVWMWRGQDLIFEVGLCKIKSYLRTSLLGAKTRHLIRNIGP